MRADNRPPRARLAELARRVETPPAKRADDFGSTPVVPPDADLLATGWRRTPSGRMVPPARFNVWL